MWICKCDCGKTKPIRKLFLLAGRRLSCGCRIKFKLEEIICSVCKKLKHRNEYYIKPDGNLNHHKCKACIIGEIKTKSRILKSIAIKQYSNGQSKCICCGESNIEFLQIDHIGGWGKIHRSEIFKKNSNKDIYRWLYKNNYPKLELQVLCANCNFSHGAYGYCPHKSQSLF